jgi:hypothetical protein
MRPGVARPPTGTTVASESKRNTAVFTALLTVLGGTSLLLLALRPTPLPGAGGQTALSFQAPGLMARSAPTPPPHEEAASGETPQLPVDPPTVVTEQSQPTNRVTGWTKVFLHSTRGGSVESVAGDHFVILPGLTPSEGRLQINGNWKNQKPATGLRGVKLPEGCVTIVLVGDFDRNQPTPGQLTILKQLLAKLDTQFGVTAAPLVVTQANNPAAIGRNFSAEWLVANPGR